MAVFSHDELVQRDAAAAISATVAERNANRYQAARPDDQQQLVVQAKQTICGSIRCASIASEFAVESDIVSAFHAGCYAANHGTCIPLAPLLDFAIANRLSRSPQYFGRRTGHFIPLWSEYDLWLDELFWGQGPRSNRAAIGEGIPYWADTVSFAWPCHNSGATDETCWAEAYEQLLDKAGSTEAVLSIWREPRSSDAKLWAEFWAPASGAGNMKEQYKAWASFRQGTTAAGQLFGNDVHEYFDHHATFLYRQADDPPLHPDQLRRLHLLRLRHSVSGPILGTPDEQDPHLGQIPLAALVRDPFTAAYSAIVNHEVTFLNNPPVKKPPRAVHLHICYAPRYRSVAETHRHIKQSPRRQAAERPMQSVPWEASSSLTATHASTVKGLAALLLEDWRHVLNGLPVRFHVHVFAEADPVPADSQIIEKTCERSGLTAGMRWRDDHGLPPADIVGKLFRRHTRAEMLKTTSAEENDAAIGEDPAPRRDCGNGLAERVCGSHWFCGVVSSLDLPVRKLSSDNWLAIKWILPERTNHLIVVDHPSGRARLFQVRQHRGENTGERELRAIYFAEALGDDLSFCSLRSECIDMVLGVVEFVYR